MPQTLKKPDILLNVNRFCPGCGHGVVTKLIASAMEELGVKKAIGVIAVGCSCFFYRAMGTDIIQAQHGRAAAVAAGVKKARPDCFVYTYQGDGDAGAIGLSETLYAAKRNERITTFFINNGVFGMTGGQMAPTSIEGQITKTSRKGCDYDRAGEPLKLAELQSNFNVGYVARGSIANAGEIQKTRRYIKKAIEAQLSGKGYSFVEILSQCPTNWGLSPVASLDRLEKEAMKIFPCGEMRSEAKA